MRSKSRGHVRLASGDARDKPKILFNYLSHPDDLAEFRAGVRLTREIFAQKAFDPYRGREIQPGKDVRDRRRRSTPSCARRSRAPTTRRAAAGWGARAIRWRWWIPKARVYGIEALRVIDSSIMPSITTGNLNAPTIMLAEKAGGPRARPVTPS